ncbi:hypothetical protein MOQ72_35570 [Saccharopolyspora sp. K220]|uniref:hypothetical protein n=1 Tax=Saccharopolyspora soli TaxID=2926618 RepID=UPI001F574EF9|nr:hypothetical protein [Saccharopolyspora soli]MCI2422759.1 hypothetical protein [Saccharopolyspora soli]
MKTRYVGNPDAGTTEIAPGLPLYNEVRVEAREYQDFDVDAVIRLENGRLGVSELKIKQRVGGPSVTSEALRSIAVGQFLRRSFIASNELRPGEADDYDPVRRVAFGLLRAEDRDRMKEAGPVTETLRWVSVIYRAALATGDAPTKAVQESFDVPRYTADRWVAKAREREFLGPAEGPGKAGA